MTMSSLQKTKKQDKTFTSEKAPASFLLKRSRAFVVFCMITAILLFSLSGCRSAEKKTTRSLFALDTYITITLEGKDSEEAANEAANYIMELERKLSRQDPGSEISSLNLSSKEMPVTLSKETYDLLSMVVEYSNETEGRFDLTIAPVMDIWGFGTEDAHVPTQEEIAEVLPLVDYSKVHLLPDNKAYLEEGVKVDLGGAAKGYIGDLLMEKLEGYKLSKIILDLGGNICCGSSSSELNIGIISPLSSDQLCCTYSLPKGQNCSVITSGAYERNIEENGVRYGHIMDTSTGYPADTDLLSATVIGPDGTKGDVYSTTLFSLGSEKAMELSSREGIDCILCMENGTLWVSSTLEGKVNAQEGWKIEYFS